MAEPFKNLFNAGIICGMAGHFKQQWSVFDEAGFIAAASENLDALELKARSEQIMQAMHRYLPDDFVHAGEIMHESLGRVLGDDLSTGVVDEHGIAGWAVMPMAHYVGLYGHDHFELSMKLLRAMTQRFSSEFAIRFFLLRSPDKTVQVLKNWAKDEDQHVRRLVSEGSRPRLPWAMQLPLFMHDPSPVITLLEMLKDDAHAYVRRSVANNLNDIAKEHPDLVASIAERWMKNASMERKKLIRHGCRSLLKSGHKKTLEVLGYKTPKLQNVTLGILTPEVMFGGALEFTVSLDSGTNEDQALMIDYIVHHQKANAKTSPKVFKWKTLTLAANKKLTSTKKHAMKKITTRVYYPGAHTVEIVINGISLAKADFILQMPSKVD